ncbi:MAG: CrcB family protein [Actinobacteria bacterium]|nr:CrcB family protein [Actinomycetota bacterium]
MKKLFAVAIGGSIGALARYQFVSPGDEIGLFLVNTLGVLVAGLFAYRIHNSELATACDHILLWNRGGEYRAAVSHQTKGAVVRLGLFLLGSFIGAPTRYLIDQYFRSYMKFPLGILIVNVSGAFLLGVVANSETDIAFALMGFCGALTTWSTFALDLFDELKTKNYRTFLINLFSNYGVGIAAALTGVWLTR